MSNQFWNAEGTKIAGDTNSVGLRSSRFANLCTPLDAKSCNYYQKGNGVIVETISQYLERMITGSRSFGQQITIILPKEGYVLLPRYDMSLWESASENFNSYYYTFIDGLADENFKEIETSFKKEVIPFVNTDTPSISDYNLHFALTYGQYPNVRLIVDDDVGNRFERTEKPYFNLVGGVVDSITFGVLEKALTGVIILSK